MILEVSWGQPLDTFFRALTISWSRLLAHVCEVALTLLVKWAINPPPPPPNGFIPLPMNAKVAFPANTHELLGNAHFT